MNSNLSARIAPILSTRGGSNSWAQSKAVVKAFLAGDQVGVPPLSLEYAPTLACNAACGFCPYASTRHKTLNGETVPLGELSPEDDVHASRPETARLIIDSAKAAGVKGVLITGGGEPTILPSLFDLLKYCGSNELDTAIYTNGFEIAQDPEFARQLLDPSHRMVFCRVSINSASEKASRLHWGVRFPVFDRQLLALERLFQAREDLLPLFAEHNLPVPSIQVSTIVEWRTIGDLEEICMRVADCFRKYPKVRADDDTFVVRPLTVHGRKRYSTTDHDESMIRQIIDIAGPDGSVRPFVESSDLALFLGFGLDRIARKEFKTYSDLLSAEYASRYSSLANGIFLTVGPDASVYPSTERNCNPAWAIGNLKEQSVAEIYQGSQRKEILKRLEAAQWGPEVSQPTPRTSRLDRIARAVQTGQLNARDIAAIRRISLNSHRLLLD